VQISELREYQAEFEKYRAEISSENKEIFKLTKRFRKDYSLEKIKNLSLDEYVTGKQNPSTFCNRIENELNNWGNIHGSTAKKFGIYFGVDGDDKEKKYRVGKLAFGASTFEAFDKVKQSIIQLLENHNNVKVIKNNLISPMFKGKILSIYYPEDYLNIFSSSHLNYFINFLGIENISKSEIDKQVQLLNYKNKDSVMKEWSVFEFSKFLYHSFGKPSSKNENRLPNELAKFKLAEFPPIEEIKAEFISLVTDNMKDKNTNKLGGKSRKIDFSGQSKRFKRIGDRGEQIVVIVERQNLINNNQIDLSRKVDHIANRDDSVGYDILSYDEKGNKKFIEVKSTTKPAGICNIYISSNELQTARKIANYYFYIVFNVGTKRPQIWKIQGAELLDDKNIIIEPISYKIGFRTNEIKV